MSLAAAQPSAGRLRAARWPRRAAEYVITSLAPIFGDARFRQTLRFFHDIFLFKDLSYRDLARLTRKMMEKTYGPGDTVFQEGEVGRAFFIVAEGGVEVYRRDPATGSPTPVAQFGPGDFFGEMVLLDELPRSATCRTTETTRLFVMYKDHFDLLMAEAPSVACPVLHGLSRLLSARLRREKRPFSRIADEEHHP